MPGVSAWKRQRKRVVGHAADHRTVPLRHENAAHRVIRTWGYYPGPPDLAIEVVNFDETCADMERRADRWITVGTRIVIVVDPRTKAVVIVTSAGKTYLGDGDVITAEDVIPGWSLPVRDIFDYACH